MTSVPDADREASADSVPTRAVRAAGWSFGNTIAARLGTLVIGIALARVLGPHEFGIFAIALVTQAALLSFNEAGVSLAIVRWRDDPRTFAPTVNTIATATSGALMAAVFVAAPWIAAGLGDRGATPVVRVLAVSILLDGLVATSAAAMQREFMQRRRAVADQVHTWLGAGVALGLALAGMGAMSLAIGRVVASVAFGILLVRWSPIPFRFGWDRAVAVRLIHFGMPLAGASLVVFASGYADQMIVGSVAGAQVLGFYVLAFNLANWPASIFSQPLRAVAPAAFSALKGQPERMNRNFRRVLTLLSCVALPACLAISGAADAVVRFAYGSAWAPAAQILVWAAAFSALRIWFELCYDFLVICVAPRRVLAIQAATFAVCVPVMLAVVGPDGAVGVARAQVLVGLLVSLPLYVLALHGVGLAGRHLAAGVAVPILAACAVWGAAHSVAATGMSPFGAAVTAGSVALAVIVLLGWWQRDDLRVLRDRGRGQVVA